MEWMNRANRPNQPAAPAQANGAPGGHTAHHARGGDDTPKWTRVASVVMLLCVGVLVLALIALSIFGKSSSEINREDKFVNGTRLQAVFLNGGQVYFGNITNLNDQYIRLANIYYLRVNQQVQPNQTNSQATSNDISLVKLGCELHGPDDSMLINRDQVIFWENLKTDGQVAKAVADYVKQNPNGQKCDTSSSSNATTPPAATPTPTPSTTKKP